MHASSPSLSMGGAAWMSVAGKLAPGLTIPLKLPRLGCRFVLSVGKRLLSRSMPYCICTVSCRVA